jgi:phenylalanyl-tRNA synthetase beta chain
VKLPLSWLGDHVDPGLSAEELADRLTMTGTKVEAILRRGVDGGEGNLARFIVGRVLEAERHPDADRLSLCRVDIGQDEPALIVCGAPNVAAGQTVAVALPGAVLPGGLTLERRTIRGFESRGMILSETEVELGAEGSGIMVLEEGPSPGAPLAEALPLAETVLDLEITSNRPDQLSVWGLAREVHAVTGAPLRSPAWEDPPATGPGSVADHVALEVRAPDLCPRYMARVLTGVRVGPSPLWLRARLEAAGMRPISNVVDITNYVMLLTGQPLHAFDLDRVAGRRIVVRRAGDGERIVTLDGQERTLDSSMLAICDAEKPAVIAGIFGAESAEVHQDTTTVLLEAATFDGPTILDTSLRLGLRTESSARFEKGLPPELPPRAMALACRMLVELAGAELVPGTLDACEPIPERPPVRMRHARADMLLAVEVPPARSAEILEALGCEVRRGPEAHEVAVPFERASDLTREADLIEEVGRIVGLEHVPTRLPRLAAHARRTPWQAMQHRLARRAADLGLAEAISYHFVPASDVDRLRLAPDDPRRELVRIANPLSEEMAVMRRSLVPGLLRAAARNQARQLPAGALFEAGRTYAPLPDGMADEREWLVGLLFGQPPREHWRRPPEPVDLFRVKGIAEALAASARVALETGPAAQPYGHPARQAELRAGGAKVGWCGEIHPLVLRDFDVRGPAAAFGLDLGALFEAAPAGWPEYRAMLSVPASQRDLAVVVDDTVAAADLVAAAREAGGDLVREVRVFDRYAGDQVPEGSVSLALRLVIADPDRTLTDDEIDAPVEAVARALEARFGAERRT